MENVATSESDTILDVGCGTGIYSQFFRGQYYGVDSNEAYITQACAHFPEYKFSVMSGDKLTFEGKTFNHVIVIAVLHHLDNNVLIGAVKEGLRVLKDEGCLHIVEPVKPFARSSLIKAAIFRNDRGRYQRSLRELTGLLTNIGHLKKVVANSGILHDVCYLEVTKS